MRESHIEKKVVKRAQENGWYCRKFVSPGRRGVCDHYFLKNGFAVFVEFKAPGEKPTKLQEREHKRLRDHGAVVLVIDNTEMGYAFFS